MDVGWGRLQDINLNIIKLESNYILTRKMLGVTRVRPFIHLGPYHSWNPILSPLDLNDAWDEIPRDHNLSVTELECWRVCCVVDMEYNGLPLNLVRFMGSSIFVSSTSYIHHRYGVIVVQLTKLLRDMSIIFFSPLS